MGGANRGRRCVQDGEGVAFREVLVDGVAWHAVGFGDIRDADPSQCWYADRMRSALFFASCGWLFERASFCDIDGSAVAGGIHDWDGWP